MNAQQILKTCRELAAQQYPDEVLERAQYEAELLSTKVLELAKKLEHAEQSPATAREGRSEEYGVH